MPTTEVAPVAEKTLLVVHAPAVPLYVDPTPSPNSKLIPLPFVDSQVPEVGPAIVIVFCSQVFAALIEKVNG